MRLLYPDAICERVTKLTAGQLRRWGVKGLILDVDNTLTTHNNPSPDPEVLRWLDSMRAEGIAMIILSNNNPPRVKPFAELLGLDFTADAAKPLTRGFSRAAASIGLGRKEIAVIGDQIFTDVLGGNLFGARTVLVRPMEPEKTWFFRLKRRLERGILRTFQQKQKENHT